MTLILSDFKPAKFLGLMGKVYDEGFAFESDAPKRVECPYMNFVLQFLAQKRFNRYTVQ